MPILDLGLSNVMSELLEKEAVTEGNEQSLHN